jgi:hypothetical protein
LGWYDCVRGADSSPRADDRTIHDSPQHGGCGDGTGCPQKCSPAQIPRSFYLLDGKIKLASQIPLQPPDKVRIRQIRPWPKLRELDGTRQCFELLRRRLEASGTPSLHDVVDEA